MALHLMSVGGSPSACVGDVAISELANEIHSSMSDHSASSVLTPFVLWLTHEDSFALDIGGAGGNHMFKTSYQFIAVNIYIYIGLKLGCVFCVRVNAIILCCAVSGLCVNLTIGSL